MQLERNNATEARTREVSSSRAEAVRYVARRPGTRLRYETAAQGRVRLGQVDRDGNDCTSTVLVAGSAGLTTQQAAIEMQARSRRFQQIPGTLRRRLRTLWRGRSMPMGPGGGSPRSRDFRFEQTKLGESLMQRGGNVAGPNRGAEEAKQVTAKRVSRARTDGDRDSSRGADDE